MRSALLVLVVLTTLGCDKQAHDRIDDLVPEVQANRNRLNEHTPRLQAVEDGLQNVRRDVEDLKRRPETPTSEGDSAYQSVVIDGRRYYTEKKREDPSSDKSRIREYGDYMLEVDSEIQRFKRRIGVNNENTEILNELQLIRQGLTTLGETVDGYGERLRERADSQDAVLQGIERDIAALPRQVVDLLDLDQWADSMFRKVSRLTPEALRRVMPLIERALDNKVQEMKLQGREVIIVQGQPTAVQIRTPTYQCSSYRGNIQLHHGWWVDRHGVRHHRYWYR